MKTHCKRGHSLENAYRTSDGRRHCRECQRQRRITYKQRHAERLRETRKRYEKPSQQTCSECGETRIVWSTATRCRKCYDARGSRRLKKCAYCKTEFVAKLSTIKFCSIACRKAGGGYKELGRKLSLERGGDGNPSYQHGRRVGVIIPGWKLSRKGEYACRNCGKKAVELHHAIPRSKCRSIKADLRNGIPLCMECHRGWHGKKVVITRSVFTEEEWEFLTSVVLTGESTSAWLDRHYPLAVLEAA